MKNSKQKNLKREVNAFYFLGEHNSRGKVLNELRNFTTDEMYSIRYVIMTFMNTTWIIDVIFAQNNFSRNYLCFI